MALSFEPDNFPLAGTLGYRSLSHEPLFRAPLNNEMERLRTELGSVGLNELLGRNAQEKS